MKILAIISLWLAAGEGLEHQDNVGSYSHFLDKKSFIYNSGVGADLRNEVTDDRPQKKEETVQEKRDEITEAQNTSPKDITAHTLQMSIKFQAGICPSKTRGH